MGRQPWVVYGVMRTKDAVSNHSALVLSMTLILFIVMYVTVFGTGIRYILMLVAKGPQPLGEHPPEPEESGRPARPLSAVPDPIDSAIGLPAGRRR
jgi:cytochrome d ubiquinol oxidase subunit I